MVNHVIDGTKMILSFYNVIDVNRISINADGCCFKNHARLIKGEFAPLNVIRVIGKLNLELMINTALYF